jgi:hypothetical protein
MLIVCCVILTEIISVDDCDNEHNFYEDNYDDAFGNRDLNFLNTLDH